MKMTTEFSRLNLIALIFLLLMVSCKKDGGEFLIKETDLCLVEIEGNFEEIELEENPEYLNGGDEAFRKAIGENSRYPPEARENDIEGICVINYEITKEGTVENIEALQDPGGGIGGAAVKTVELVTEGISFSPGILNGVPVRVKKELEVKFELE